MKIYLMRRFKCNKSEITHYIVCSIYSNNQIYISVQFIFQIPK